MSGKERLATPGKGRRKPKPTARPLNLALQGGGAHGAFTWGVLDRLLQDERIVIEGVSGTSAGAMNAAVLVQGYGENGRDGARAALDAFWHRISELSHLAPVQRSPFQTLFGGGWNLDQSPAYWWLDAVSRVLSPYQFNPLNINPLREVLDGVLDPGRIAASNAVKLFVSATNVRSGKVRVFENGEVTVDALLASACLPFLFQAVEVDGEAYWDGGYMGNPSLFPLIYGCDSPDIAIVQINPLHRDEVPKTAAAIANRVNEISFNSTLMREMRAIAFVRRLIEAEGLDPSKYKRVNMHLIGDEADMKELGVSSKLNADWDFLQHLKAIGARTADDWLAQHVDRIGVDSTCDIPSVFLYTAGSLAREGARSAMPARDRIIRPNTRRSRFENRRLHTVEGGGGLSLLVAEGGRPDGPSIILLHGFSQCHLCWYRQFEGRLADRFRLVAPDLRGHGGSAKPEDKASYSDGALWADDLAAVIETLDLERPVVVAWSYAGAVVGDYLRHRGSSALAGINFVGAVAKLGPGSVPLLGPDLLGSTPGLLSPDPGKNVVAARRFVHGTTAAPMSPDDNDMAMAGTMMVPPAVRRRVLGRTEDYDDVLAAIDVPVLVSVGMSDVMVSPGMAEHIAAVVPGAVLSRYPAVGHAPFLEVRERFDRELERFVEDCLSGATDGRS